MTAHLRHQIAIIATVAFLVLVRADVMLLVAGMLLLTGLALNIRIHPHHHGRHA